MFQLLRQTRSGLSGFVWFFLGSLLFLSLARISWVLLYWDRIAAVQGFWPIVRVGIQLDVSLLCYLIFMPLCWYFISPNRWLQKPLMTALFAGYFALAASVIVLLEYNTPMFIQEYDLRPNRVFVEYLFYPKEVFSMLWSDHALVLVIAVILVLLVAKYSFHALRQQFAHPPPRYTQKLIFIPMILLCVLMGGRASVDHRPANPSIAAFSEDHLANDLGMSSLYKVLFALYDLKNEADASLVYGHLATQKIDQIVRDNMRLDEAQFIQAGTTHHRQIATNQTNKPLNLVIILEESLGAQFSKRLRGQRDLTPNLDRWADHGMWLEHLYATGTRSVRGIEAVVTGFPPSPARSVVKLGLAQKGFSTLASILASKGYDTEFIYGGESHFDNMRGFFLGNGFARVIDQQDYIKPNFVSTWGVSDEDLFHKVHQRILASQDKPFFKLVFTTSFHAPFEYPKGKVPETENVEYNNVRYADYALGQFLAQAKDAAYWQNTLFLVVADHDARARGRLLVPVRHFHIPGLLLGASIQPQIYSSVASQLDLPPTLLSLMGISSIHPMIGHDLTQLPATYAGRALLQYERQYAYLEGSHMLVYRPHRAPTQYRYTKLAHEPVDPVLAEKALAHALWASKTYQQQQYGMHPNGR